MKKKGKALIREIREDKIERAIPREVRFFAEWVKTRNVGKAYREIEPNIDKDMAKVEGEKMLASLEVDKVLKVYGLDMDTYLKQLKGGLEAMKWIDDGEGMLETPDHTVRRQYHKILGELLKLEGMEEKSGGVLVLKGLVVLSGIEEEPKRDIIDIRERDEKD